MTAGEVQQAYALLQTLATLRSQKAAFGNATTFRIQGLGAHGDIGTATFSAEGYGTAIATAFDAQIATVTTQLTALGVTGF